MDAELEQWQSARAQESEQALLAPVEDAEAGGAAEAAGGAAAEGGDDAMEAENL